MKNFVISDLHLAHTNICPNCHSQTETYTGNKSRKRKEKAA